MRRIDDGERRARLTRRHHLASDAKATTVEEVVTDLVGLHSSDPVTVFLAAAARMANPSVAAIEKALYEDRSVFRMLGMRRTMFVVPAGLVPVVQAACTNALVPVQRRVLVRLLEDGGITTDGDGWLAAVEAKTLAALEARGDAFAADLSKDVAELRARMRYAEGKSYAGEISASTRVLFLLSMQGLIARGRPRGSWISSQYQWTPMATWLPGGVGALPATEARAELVRRWLLAFGPAPVADLKWWTGWSMGDTRKSLAALPTEDVELEAGAGVVLADDVDPVAAPAPSAVLLPGLDPTPMGWSERGWFLGPHRQALFDRSGNIGPTLWWEGRIVGGWAQRNSGDVVYRLLEDVGADAVEAVEREVERLTALLGDVRPTPRFRTPLERELAS